MSRPYIVQEGDTFESLSRRFYGIESGASVIQSANPDLSGGIVVGATIVIPSNPFATTGEAVERLFREGADEDQWIIFVSGKEFRFWRDVRVTRSIDSVSLFEFSAPWEPDNEAFREVFRPLSFQSCSVFIGTELVVGGTLVDVSPTFGTARDVTASGYSRFGVMRDTTLPAGTPLEFDEVNLQAIAIALSKPFGLIPAFNADPGPVFEYGLSIDAVERPLGFLRKLAQQRNLVIGSTPRGNPLFHRTTTAPPVETLEEGVLPLTSIQPRFKAQDFFSHISSLTPSFFGGTGDAHTIVNPRLRGVVRPHSFRVNDTYGADGVASAEAKIGRMYANAVAWDATVIDIRDSQGRLWKPNTKIRVTAPSAMIYESTELLIRTATLVRRGRSQITQLRLVFPESFNGEVPPGFPWDL